MSKYRISQNPRTKRWTVFKRNPKLIGKFGEWMIVSGGFKTTRHAKEYLSKHGNPVGLTASALSSLVVSSRHLSKKKEKKLL